MKRLVLLLALVAGPTGMVTAQRPMIRVSGGGTLAQYREQNLVLDFRGDGPAGRVEIGWRRWSGVANIARYTFRPTDTNAPYVMGFQATATGLGLRFQALRRLPFWVEAGVERRISTPSDNAQSYRAFRLGAVARLLLADGAEVEPQAAWLVGSRFSGGGSAPTAVALGLRAAYRPLKRFGWGWVVADYKFEHFDRKTDVAVPLQGSSVSFGIEARVVP